MKYILIYSVILILFYEIINNIWLKEIVDKHQNNRNLKKDGYIVFNGKINNDTVLKNLQSDYVFIDYKYVIKGCTLSTFHRDVTSSKYIFKTKYPIYTYIVYNNKGPLLSVCPGSHLTTPFLYSKPLTIIGKNSSTSILFDSDLVHAGALNNLGDLRYAIQYKIAHKDDLNSLKSLSNIYTEKIGKCNISKNYEIFSRKISILFSYIINHHFTKYLQYNDNGIFNKLGLYLYGREFYN